MELQTHPMQPKPRYGTNKAINALSKTLDIPFKDFMQDWSYTEGNPEHIEQYITHYKLIADEDEQFVLMELIIQATEDQKRENLFEKYSKTIKPILENNFKLHEYTIYYWACFDNENLEEAFKITPLMRKLWQENN